MNDKQRQQQREASAMAERRTRAQNWRAIGEAFEEYAVTGEASRLASLGLCCAWDRRTGDNGMYFGKMDALMGESYGNTHFGDYTRRNARVRALAAYFLAEVAKNP